MDNLKDRRKAISPESNRASTALAQSGENENLKELTPQPLKRQRMRGALAQRFDGWDSRAKQRLEKSGVKVNKKCGATCAKHGYHS